MRIRWHRSPLAAAVAVLGGCGGVDVETGAGELDAATGAAIDASESDAGTTVDGGGGLPDAAAGSSVVVLYDFEEPLQQEGADLLVLDESGNDRHGVVTVPDTNAGTVERVARSDRSGSALQFPAPCNPETQVCPRVHLAAQRSVDLNPGQLDFAISLDLLVPEPAGGGILTEQNVAQKGNFDDDGQWKIEFDPQRRVSCTFHFPMEAGAPVTLRVPGALRVGEWHSLRCERRGKVLSLRLDEGAGTDTQIFEIPDGVEVDIANARPIVVGGQDTGQAADQFHGTLDNVSIEIVDPR